MSFNTALSGLNAASSDLGVISNNVANASTTGFKGSRAEFADIYATSALGGSSTAIGSGVLLSNVAQQFNQGNLEFTDNTLDMAINGEGFFTLSADASTLNQSSLYSRAGNFSVDADGYIVNGQGLYLQGFPVNSADGTISSTQTQSLTLPSAAGTPSATTEIKLGVNLPAGVSGQDPLGFNPADSTTFSASTTLTAYDSLGTPRLTTAYFVKNETASGTYPANSWSVFHYIEGDENAAGIKVPMSIPLNTVAAAAAVPPITTGTATNGDQFATLQFDGNGTLTSPTAGTMISSIAGGIPGPAGTSFSNGANAMSLDFDYGNNGSTQVNAAFNVSLLGQDGRTTGQLSGLEINEKGVIQANYTNGSQEFLGVIALSKFQNPQGLRAVGSTAWEQSLSSGTALPGEPGTNGFGKIQSGALESSNVDLTEQLVKLITAQRNFQANAKSIETASAVTQSVLQLR